MKNHTKLLNNLNKQGIMSTVTFNDAQWKGILKSKEHELQSRLGKNKNVCDAVIKRIAEPVFLEHLSENIYFISKVIRNLPADYENDVLVKIILNKLQTTVVKGKNNKYYIENIDVMFCNNRSKMIMTLLDYGANPNSETCGKSALDVALEGQNELLSLKLIEKGAKVTFNHLVVAGRIQSFEKIFKKILEKGSLAFASSETKSIWNQVYFPWSVKCLIEHYKSNGKDINSLENGLTPLMHYCTSNFVDTASVNLLINNGADPILKGNKGRKAISYLASNTNCKDISKTIQLLVSNDKDFMIVDDVGKMPLHYACEYGNLRAIDFFINCKPRINLRDNDGNTALHLLANISPYYFSGNQDLFDKMIKAFLKLGANPEIINDKEANVLHIAAKSGSKNLITMIKDRLECPESTLPNGRTALHEAILSGSVGAVEAVLGLGLNPNVRDGLGNTPLHMVCAKWDDSITQDLVIRMLRAAGAKPEIQNANGDTPIHIACALGNLNSVRSVISANGLNISNYAGDFSISLACKKGNFEVVKFLLKEFPHLIEQKDNEGNTLLHSACINCHHKIMKLILENNPNLLNHQNNLGDTPLHIACRGRDPYIEDANSNGVKILLFRKPNLIKNSSGETPVDLAKNNKNPKTVQLLEKYTLDNETMVSSS